MAQAHAMVQHPPRAPLPCPSPAAHTRPTFLIFFLFPVSPLLCYYHFVWKENWFSPFHPPFPSLYNNDKGKKITRTHNTTREAKPPLLLAPPSPLSLALCVYRQTFEGHISVSLHALAAAALCRRFRIVSAIPFLFPLLLLAFVPTAVDAEPTDDGGKKNQCTIQSKNKQKQRQQGGPPHVMADSATPPPFSKNLLLDRTARA